MITFLAVWFSIGIVWLIIAAIKKWIDTSFDRGQLVVGMFFLALLWPLWLVVFIDYSNRD